MTKLRALHFLLLAIVCALAACSKQQAAKAPPPVPAEPTVVATPALTYIKCKFEGPGRDFQGLEVNFYLDETGKHLLNDNKSEFGRTQRWDMDIIQVAMDTGDGKPPYITFLNRKTGELAMYTEGKDLETRKFGSCAKAPLPGQKF